VKQLETSSVAERLTICASDSSILNWELELFSFEPGTIGGLGKEFIFASRMDDKLCSWAALQGLIEASRDLNGRGTISMCALYDDEEVGSKLRQGAESNLMSGLAFSSQFAHISNHLYRQCN